MAAVNSPPPLLLTPLRGTEDPTNFAAALAEGLFDSEDAPRELLDQTRTFLDANPRPDPWGSYLAIDGNTAVGTCAFKTAPDGTGAVEIAYWTFPAFENRGYAKRMVAALVELATSSGASQLFANTLPEENASNGALRSEGFRFAGEVVDPDDGSVWRWEKHA